MSRVSTLLLVSFLCLSAQGASAQDPADLTDAQKAQFARVAGELDLAGANLALTKGSSVAVKGYATATVSSLTASMKAAAGSLAKLDIAPEESELSRALSREAQERQHGLSELSGPAFDKAYADNERMYYAIVIGVMEVNLIPNARSAASKSYLGGELTVMKQRFAQAQRLADEIK